MSLLERKHTVQELVVLFVLHLPGQSCVCGYLHPKHKHVLSIPKNMRNTACSSILAAAYGCPQPTPSETAIDTHGIPRHNVSCSHSVGCNDVPEK